MVIIVLELQSDITTSIWLFVQKEIHFVEKAILQGNNKDKLSIGVKILQISRHRFGIIKKNLLKAIFLSLQAICILGHTRD